MTFWRDADHAGGGPFPRSVPLRVVLLVAVLSGVGITAYRYAELWTPLQRRYLGAYLRSAVAMTTRGEYALWQVVDQRGSRLAVDEELVSVTSATGETTFALSDAVVTAGATGLVWRRESYPHAALHAFLRRWIYHEQTPLDLLLPALWAALALFLGGVIGVRAQAVVDARTWRARSRMWHPQGSMPPVILDHVDRSPRAPASLPAAAHGLGASAAGSAPPGPAPPAAWPDPFFQ